MSDTPPNDTEITSEKSTDDKKKIPVVNIMTIGDTNVGKTSMILRFSDDEFYEQYMSTLGIGIKSKVINILNGTQPVLLRIWDTAGQEKFQSIAKSYYQNADGIFVVFDLSSQVTYGKIQFFLHSIEEFAHEYVSIVLVGNKCDLIDKRIINQKEAQDLANSNSIKYFETSAKTGDNINEAFCYLAEIAYNNIPTSNIQYGSIEPVEGKNVACKC